MNDKRYIRIHGAPVVAVSGIENIVNRAVTLTMFRRAAAKCGIPELHLAMLQSSGFEDPRLFGFDAAIEHMPGDAKRLLLDPAQIGVMSSEFEGSLDDYVGIVAQSVNARPPDYRLYRGCAPTWDSTPRDRTKGRVALNDSPKAYAQWLRFLSHEALVRRDQVEPFIFINAWNDWSNGAYLEPDDVYGRGILEVTHCALHQGFVDFMRGVTPVSERSFSRAVSITPAAIRQNYWRWV